MDKESLPEAELLRIQSAETPNPEESEQPEEQTLAKTNKRWFKPLLIGTGLGIAIALGGTRLIGNNSTGSEPARANQTKAATAPAMTVTTTDVQSQSVTRTLSVKGSIAASNLTPVLPQSNGLQIKEVRANVGDSVQKGEILAVLDNSLLQEQIRQVKAEVESRQADVTSKQADLRSRQAAVASSLAAVESNQALVKQRQADLGQAKARLLDAERNYQRNQKLAADGAISRQVLDTAQTNLIAAREAVRQAEANIRSAEASVKSAQASVATAQANVQSARANINIAKANVRSNIARIAQLETQRDQTVVRAPVAGIIAEKLARVGDVTGVPPQTQVSTVIGGSQKLFSIIQNGQLELQALVPEVQLRQIRLGAAATVTSDTDPDLRFQGTVKEIEPVINQQSREATVKIGLPGNARLKPGMFAKAEIDTNSSLSLVVPQKSVQHQPDGSKLVFVVQENQENSDIGQVTAKKVETGDIINKDRLEIKTGLQAGDRIVLEGAGYLKDGDNVKIVKE